jgi:excisionase family DNA binding protein
LRIAERAGAARRSNDEFAATKCGTRKLDLIPVCADDDVWGLLGGRPAQCGARSAADILVISRPHLIKLLDRGEIPFHRVGTHRRLKINDVLAYRDRRAAERDAALRELTSLSEELPGGYR